MTTTPPPAEGAPEAGLPQSSSAQATTGAQANVERATALTEELIDRGAPWSSRTSWRIVLVEGIVAGLLGLIFLFKPLGGSSTTLQLSGLILLVAALITTFQVWRHKIRPDLEVLASFRAGSGVTVGLVTFVAALFTQVTDAVTMSLAVVVGMGFIVFGLVGIANSFVRRATNQPLPMASLIANAVLALAGGVLMLAGPQGKDAVDGIFNLLGILLIAAGVILAGYSYLLYQQEAQGLRR